MAELVFFSGTMDCGKSTLALQLAHNRTARGLSGVMYTRHDRAGESVLSSRLGLKADAVEVAAALDLWADVTTRRMHGDRVDFLGDLDLPLQIVAHGRRDDVLHDLLHGRTPLDLDTNTLLDDDED